MEIDYSTLPNIEPIKIMLNTNLPGKESTQLTSSMLYHPSVKEMPKLSEFPFIIMDRPYSQGISSYLSRKPYEKKVKFFFNKESHLKGLSTVGLYTPNKAKKKETPKPEEEMKKKDEKKKKKEINEEIDELIRNINEKKIASVKEAEVLHKKKLRNLEKTNDEARITAENQTYKTTIDKLKTKFKFQLKYVKANYIGLSANKKKYVLQKIGDENKVPLEPNITETDISSDEYTPLYTDDKGNPLYLDLHKAVEEIKISDDNKSKELSAIEKPKGYFGYANENIMILLQTLFPNSFPVLNNITESFRMMIMQEPLPFTFKNAIPTFLRPNAYPGQFFSYLKIGGTVYTSTQLIWLNDIYNHPVYSGLVLKYKIFNGAKEGAKLKLEAELDKKRAKFKADFSASGSFAIDEKLVTFFKKQKKPEPETPTFGDNTVRDLNQTIDIIIENIEDLMSYLEFDPPKYKLILDVTNSIRQLYKKIEDKIVKTKDIDTKLTRLVKSIGAINTFEVIFSKYLDSSEVVLDYETEEEAIKTELKTKYQFYVTFVDSLKEFIRPVKESSNTELQEVLEDFSSGVVGSQEKFETLMTPQDLIELSDRNMANTGVSILPITGKDPRLEIQVQMDFIEGELNDENKSKINCIYKGEFLGTMLDQLLYPQKTKWELNKKRLFFNINDKEVQKEIKEKEAKSPSPPGSNSAPIPSTKEPIKQGGRRTYKRLPIFKLRRMSRRK